MPASRILALARTSRWAMVASGTRNARAISAVVSPPSSRSVRATWAAGDRAGWQQVNSSRSRSSRTGPSSVGSSGCRWACSSAAWAWRSSRVASRRSRSIALFRAVVMTHPGGLGGVPVRGQVRRAAANASWTASSAASMLPRTRVRTATARPYSVRKTRPTSSAVTAGGAAGGGWPAGRSVLGTVVEGADLDRQGGGAGRPLRPAKRDVEVGGVDHPESAEVLLALDVGAVGREDLAVADAHDGGAGRVVQAAGEDP